MTLRPSALFAVLGVILLVLVVIAVFLPRGPEKLAAHESSKLPSATLRACLGSGLGLGAWQGPPVVMRASRFGLRVAVSDNGKERHIGVFTAGGQPLSSGQTAALQACLGGN